MEKETSVSWLLDQYLKKDGLSKSDFIKAFEMEEQQITKAFYDGYYQEEVKDYRSYYTETFKPVQDERFN